MHYEIEFLREHLDKLIKSWRQKEIEAQEAEDCIRASHHVAAYQSLREDIFGERLVITSF